MTISGVTDTPVASTVTSNTSTSAADSVSADQDKFMKLLVTQLKNQDPLNPMDNAAMTSQLAQLSTVTGINKVNATLESLRTDQANAQSLTATNLIGKGVLVALNDQIHAARDVTKTNTSTLDSFKTPELGMLGYIQGNKPYFYHVSARKHTVDTEFDISKLDALPQVDIVYGYANMGPAALNAVVTAGAKGVIHAGVGDGSLAGKVVPALKAARQQGVLIVRASRVGQGIVARNGEANDDELDFVAADTLNPQKARILLMLALTRSSDSKEIQRMFYRY